MHAALHRPADLRLQRGDQPSQRRVLRKQLEDLEVAEARQFAQLVLQLVELHRVECHLRKRLVRLDVDKSDLGDQPLHTLEAQRIAVRRRRGRAAARRQRGRGSARRCRRRHRVS
eukprot:6696217-Prymnesium_polylepis.1